MKELEATNLIKHVMGKFADQLQEVQKRGVEPQRVYIGIKLKARILAAAKRNGIPMFDNPQGKVELFGGLVIYTVENDPSHFQVV